MLERNRGSSASGARGQSGYTMLDLTVGVMILVIAVGAISTSLTSGFSLNRANRERAIAMEVAEGIVERIRSETFEEIFARYNRTTADDPGLGASPGATFDVPGLRPRLNDPDGFVGQIQFPGDGTELREDFVDRDLGMPRDLNGDGAPPDALDHSGDYLVLPVRVTVSWLGAGSVQEVELVTTVARR